MFLPNNQIPNSSPAEADAGAGAQAPQAPGGVEAASSPRGVIRGESNTRGKSTDMDRPGHGREVAPGSCRAPKRNAGCSAPG
jgi:hypothetical protein